MRALGTSPIRFVTTFERFISHWLSVGDDYADFARLYGNNLRFWTKSQLVLGDFDYVDNPDNSHSYDCFPQPLPDAYLEVYNEASGGSEYLLEVWHDNVPFFVYRNRIKYYIEYVYEDTWKDTVGSELPPVLLVCDSPTLQRRVQRFLKKMVDEIDGNELRFMMTHRPLLTSAKLSVAMWTGYDESQEKFVVQGL